MYIFFSFFSLIEGEFVPSEEFPEGGPAAIRNLDTDPFLRIQVLFFSKRIERLVNYSFNADAHSIWLLEI